MNTPSIRPSRLKAAWEITVAIVALVCFFVVMLCIGIFGSKKTIAQLDAALNALDE